MFGMNGFHVSASGAIQGHDGPLVGIISQELSLGDSFKKMFAKLFAVFEIISKNGSLGDPFQNLFAKF